MVGINTYPISLVDARKLKSAMADVVAKQLVAASQLSYKRCRVEAMAPRSPYPSRDGNTLPGAYSATANACMHLRKASHVLDTVFDAYGVDDGDKSTSRRVGWRAEKKGQR